ILTKGSSRGLLDLMVRLLKAHSRACRMLSASYSLSSPMVLIRGISCSASSARIGVFPSEYLWLRMKFIVVCRVGAEPHPQLVVLRFRVSGLPTPSCARRV